MNETALNETAVSVTTWTLEMTSPLAADPKPLPDGIRIELAEDISPEYARFLYGLVGGPWTWTDRLCWTREQWDADLAVPGTETWIAYGDGSPLGYVQLQPGPDSEDGLDVEIRYFGLVEQAMGRGLGGALLARGVQEAWSLGERYGLPAVRRVWVHTCSLDGPVALANYQARGFRIVNETQTQESYPAEPLGSWTSTTTTPK